MAEEWTKQDEQKFKQLRREFIMETRRRMRAVSQQQERGNEQKEARNALFNRQRELEEDTSFAGEELSDISVSFKIIFIFHAFTILIYFHEYFLFETKGVINLVRKKLSQKAIILCILLMDYEKTT